MPLGHSAQVFGFGNPRHRPAASGEALMRGQGPQVRGPRGQRLRLTGSFWQSKEGGRKEKAGTWGQVWVNPRFLTAGPRQAACSGRC